MHSELKGQAPCPVQQARLLVSVAKRAIATVPGLEREQADLARVLNRLQERASIHAPNGAHLEEATPFHNKSFSPEVGGFKPAMVIGEMLSVSTEGGVVVVH